MRGWIGVDFDGTLAHYDTYLGPGVYGDPIQPMLERVKQWLVDGKLVKIMTARAREPKEVEGIKTWLLRNGLPALEVTDVKDYAMIELWDDRTVTVEKNTGRVMTEGKT